MVTIAGGSPMMIYLKDRDEVLTITGLGPWPKAATLEMFVTEHDGHIPLGILRTVVPAAPDAAILALRRFGTMRFGEVASAAIRYARDGFSIHPMMVAYNAHSVENYRRWPHNERIHLRDANHPQFVAGFH